MMRQANRLVLQSIGRQKTLGTVFRYSTATRKSRSECASPERWRPGREWICATSFLLHLVVDLGISFTPMATGGNPCRPCR